MLTTKLHLGLPLRVRCDDPEHAHRWAPRPPAYYIFISTPDAAVRRARSIRGYPQGCRFLAGGSPYHSAEDLDEAVTRRLGAGHLSIRAVTRATPQP
jgi:hypothetical protein